MSSELSCATTVLKNPENAIAEIDRVLNGTPISASFLRYGQYRLFSISHDVPLSAWIVSLWEKSRYGLLFSNAS